MTAKIIGLTSEEVKKSKEAHGNNSLEKEKTKGFFGKFFENLNDPIIKILILALLIDVIFTFGNCNLFEVFGIVAAILLIVGILMLYDKIKKRLYCAHLFHTICEYAMPSLFILIGFMFLFHQGNAMNFIFVVSGILTILEGGVLLVNALSND